MVARRNYSYGIQRVVPNPNHTAGWDTPTLPFNNAISTRSLKHSTRHQNLDYWWEFEDFPWIDTTFSFHFHRFSRSNFQGLFKVWANNAIHCNFISRKVPCYLWCFVKTITSRLMFSLIRTRDLEFFLVTLFWNGSKSLRLTLFNFISHILWPAQRWWQYFTTQFKVNQQKKNRKEYKSTLL